MTNSERRNCKKGEFVFRRGEPAIELYTIVSGQVRLFGTQRGKDVTVSILEPGTMTWSSSSRSCAPRTRFALSTWASFCSGVPRKDQESGPSEGRAHGTCQV